MSKSFRAWLWPACAALALVVVSPWSARAEEVQAPPSEPRPGLAEQKILAALASPSSVQFVDQPLSDVVDFLKEKHQIEIQLDNKALTDAGIGSDTPITRHIEGISLESLLRLMLGEMDLTFVPIHEVLLITTRTEAENMLLARVYPVADLLEDEGDGLVVAAGKSHNELIEAITSLVAPTTWDEVGGPAHIKLVAGAQALAISQTFECHREIENFLAALRAAKRQAAGKPKAAADGANDEAVSLKIYKLPALWALSTGATPHSAPAANSPAAPPKADPPKAEPPKAEPPKANPAKEGGKAETPSEVLPQMGGGIGMNYQAYPTVDQVAKAIPASIEPESWTQAGGKGTISVVGPALAIRQTNRIHREIRRFLAALN